MVGEDISDVEGAGEKSAKEGVVGVKSVKVNAGSGDVVACV